MYLVFSLSAQFGFQWLLLIWWGGRVRMVNTHWTYFRSSNWIRFVGKIVVQNIVSTMTSGIHIQSQQRFVLTWLFSCDTSIKYSQEKPFTTTQPYTYGRLGNGENDKYCYTAELSNCVWHFACVWTITKRVCVYLRAEAGEVINKMH